MENATVIINGKEWVEKGVPIKMPEPPWRCCTCLKSSTHGCYGYDQGYECYEDIFKKYFELEKKYDALISTL